MRRLSGVNLHVLLRDRSPNEDTGGIVDPVKQYFKTVRCEIFINSPPYSLPVTIVVDYENSPLNKPGKEVLQLVPGRGIPVRVQS